MESHSAAFQDAILYFSDVENCRKFMADLWWPGGKVVCPRCGSERIGWLEKTRVWKCYGKHGAGVGQTFTLKTGTLFQESPIALEKWLLAAWLVVNSKRGISSYALARDLGVTQKSAWLMLRRLRLAMENGTSNKEFEADAASVGGKAESLRPGRRTRGPAEGALGHDQAASLRPPIGICVS